MEPGDDTKEPGPSTSGGPEQVRILILAGMDVFTACIDEIESLNAGARWTPRSVIPA